MWLLWNFFAKRPIFVDLDISQCSISLPGNIAATLVERPTSIEEGFPQNAPMVYHFGHTKYSNTRLYDETVKEMAGMVKKRLEANKKARTSGNLLLKRPSKTRGNSLNACVFEHVE